MEHFRLYRSRCVSRFWVPGSARASRAEIRCQFGTSPGGWRAFPHRQRSCRSLEGRGGSPSRPICFWKAFRAQVLPDTLAPLATPSLSCLTISRDAARSRRTDGRLRLLTARRLVLCGLLRCRVGKAAKRRTGNGRRRIQRGDCLPAGLCPASTVRGTTARAPPIVLNCAHGVRGCTLI
jgi:hypothetical protein